MGQKTIKGLNPLQINTILLAGPSWHWLLNWKQCSMTSRALFELLREEKCIKSWKSESGFVRSRAAICHILSLSHHTLVRKHKIS